MTTDVTTGPRPNSSWVSVTRGAHRLGTVEDPFGAELKAWQLVIPPTAAFTHLTAAQILGWPTPPLPDHLPVFVAMDRSKSPERRGLRVSRHAIAPAADSHNGLRITNASETLLACARDLGLVDLVVLVDFVLNSGACNTADLASLSAERRRGAPNLRRALALADGRSESPWESMLRILHVSCGVPVEPQRVVRNLAGDFVARGDLWIVGTRTLHEYDGAHHLTRPQQRRDLQRSGRIDDADWSRRGFTKEDVLHHAVNILRAADAALGREHDPKRIRAWHALLRDSLQTQSGMARLRKRLVLS